MNSIVLTKFQRLLLEGIFTYTIETAILLIFGLTVCGFRNKLSFKKILIYSFVMAAFMIPIRFFLASSGLHTLAYLVLGTFIIKHFFKIDYISASICQVFMILFVVIFQTLYYIILKLLFKIEFTNFLTIESFTLNLLLQKIIITYTFYLLIAIITYWIFKKNFMLLNMHKHNLLSSFNSEFVDNIKLFSIIIIPLGIFIVINFSIHFYQAYNDLEVSSIIYFAFNVIALLIASILMLLLIKKIIYLKKYKIEWESQQKYLNDIDTLLKQLRVQKHGFINHMNVIHGYLSIQSYDKAKEYLQNINQTISTKNNVLDVKNPSLNALLNVKAKIAESKDIKFEVNVNNDLSSMHFKVFEMGEAIGNIIDNAIEAVYEKNEEDRLVKINIYSNQSYYIFDIQNTGYPIPQDIIHKIFEEGFSTKTHEHDEHGLGLYISKKTIEYNKGKIEVESNDNITSFKIYLPKVENNESQVS